MRSCVRSIVAVGLLVASMVVPRTVAQSATERPVGVDFFGKPLVIKKLTASEIGALAAAAHVPMGFESAGADAEPLNVQASGKPLRVVLDAIVAADPRYEWREDNGVAVLRPATAWTDTNDFLHRSAAAIRFDDAGVSDALQLVIGLFGEDLHPSQRNTLADPKRFNLDVPPGTVIEALDAIVRAHGALAWGIEPFPPPPAVAPGTVLSPFMASLVSGGTGRAVGIGVQLDHAPKVPEQLERWGRAEPLATEPPLERVVGKKVNGEPFILSGAWDVPELATVTHTAMGLELLPPPDGPPTSGKVTITGLSLREALTALMAIDPRYEWRELDGVIVVRPVVAWTQPEHPLSRQAGPARLERATVADAANYLHAMLEPGMTFTPERDRGVEVRRVTITSADRTPLMTLLNTVARSFGEVCWIYEELNARDTAFFGGRSHQISLRSPTGEGLGFAFR